MTQEFQSPPKSHKPARILFGKTNFSRLVKTEKKKELTTLLGSQISFNESAQSSIYQTPTLPIKRPMLIK
jgi:hypothetical protein